MADRIYRILLSGGPSAGKTTVMNAVREVFGPLIEVVPEAATALLAGGLHAPINAELSMAFQQVVLPYHRYNQKVLIPLARQHGAKVIFEDRGILDGAAYVGETVSQGLAVVLDLAHMTLEEAYELSDMVILLETVARYHPERFGKAGNEHRVESNPHQAILLDDKMKEIYASHPNLKVINGQDGIDSVVDQVISILNEIIYSEIERKWLLPYLPSELPGLESVQDLEQYYLYREQGKEIRFRSIQESGHRYYEQTIKIGRGLQRAEIPLRIPEAAYVGFYPYGGEGVIRKKRYNLDDGLSIDVFEGSSHVTAEMEFFTRAESASFNLADFWRRVGAVEVTGDDRYSNAAIAAQGIPSR